MSKKSRPLPWPGDHQQEYASVTEAMAAVAKQPGVAWARGRAGVTDLAGLIHHNDAGSHYTSIAFTERLAELGVQPSIGTVADAYDNALAESTIGLFKTELIRRRGPLAQPRRR